MVLEVLVVSPFTFGGMIFGDSSGILTGIEILEFSFENVLQSTSWCAGRSATQ